MLHNRSSDPGPYHERMRPGQGHGAVLAAWGFTSGGAKVLLHLTTGSKEDAETVSAFVQDMRTRGLEDPLLVVSDGAPGIIKAIETCFPRSERQRCLAHRMRNLAAIAWRAVVGAGISSSEVRDMMLEAVETRFGTLRAPTPVEWLSDNCATIVGNWREPLSVYTEEIKRDPAYP